MEHNGVVVMQISDLVNRYIGPYQGLRGSTTAKAISMEYGLYTTAIVMLLGGAAFLLATLTVEKDRRVRTI